MKSIIQTDRQLNSEKNKSPKKSNKTLMIILTLLIGILTVAIVILSVILPKKKKNQNDEEMDQTIEILIEGNRNNKENRYLQEVEDKIKILGDNYNELDSSNALILIDGEKITFDKYLSIKSKKTIKIIIKFKQKILTFKEMFSGCSRIKEITLKNIETELILETTSMFESCTSLSGIKFENMNISNITSTAKMFQNCSILNRIEIEDFSTDKTKDMSKMFEGCTSLDNSNFIEGLSTESAESMNEMFSGCSNITSLNLSNFDTSNVKNMSGMFKGMNKLENIDIGSFNTEKVEYMSEMFENCTSIQSLNLSNFNTEMVITMERMFSSCKNLEIADLTSFNLKNCNNTESMFSYTTRELMLSIEKNEELMISAGISWTEYDQPNLIKIPLNLLFLVDATGSMGWAIDEVKEQVIYIAVNLMKKKGMKDYDLSLGAVFYRDPIESKIDIHQIFNFDKNALNFKNFVNNISAYGGGDFPEDWAGAFLLAKNLSWGNDSFNFIIHIADAPAHGNDWVGNNFVDFYPSEGKKTDEIITYFAKNNFSIAGFMVNELYSNTSFRRAQSIFRNNGNLNYFIKYFSIYETYNDYFLDLVYESFQNVLNSVILNGIDISEEQGEIDWIKVKDNNKIDFVIIRAGIGKVKDTKFEDNYKGAKNSGIPIGVYWTSSALNINNTMEEVELLKEAIQGKLFEFPIYYIIEEESIFYNKNSYSIIRTFYDNLNSLDSIKYFCGIRTTSSKFKRYFNNEILEDFQIWVNDYIEEYPVINVDWGLWKYSESGKIDGIEGSVSLDISILNYTNIIINNK